VLFFYGTTDFFFLGGYLFAFSEKTAEGEEREQKQKNKKKPHHICDVRWEGECVSV
jgi:hypothetical protein